MWVWTILHILSHTHVGLDHTTHPLTHPCGSGPYYTSSHTPVFSPCWPRIAHLHVPKHTLCTLLYSHTYIVHLLTPTPHLHLPTISTSPSHLTTHHPHLTPTCTSHLHTPHTYMHMTPTHTSHLHALHTYKHLTLHSFPLHLTSSSSLHSTLVQIILGELEVKRLNSDELIVKCCADMVEQQAKVAGQPEHKHGTLSLSVCYLTQKGVMEVTVGRAFNLPGTGKKGKVCIVWIFRD